MHHATPQISTRWARALFTLTCAIGITTPAVAAAAPWSFHNGASCEIGTAPPQASGDGMMSAQVIGECAGGHGTYANATLDISITLYREDGSVAATRQMRRVVGNRGGPRVLLSATADCVTGNYYASGTATMDVPPGYTSQNNRIEFASDLTPIDC